MTGQPAGSGPRRKTRWRSTARKAMSSRCNDSAYSRDVATCSRGRRRTPRSTLHRLPDTVAIARTGSSPHHPHRRPRRGAEDADDPVRGRPGDRVRGGAEAHKKTRRTPGWSRSTTRVNTASTSTGPPLRGQARGRLAVPGQDGDQGHGLRYHAASAGHPRPLFHRPAERTLLPPGRTGHGDPDRRWRAKCRRCERPGSRRPVCSDPEPTAGH